MAAERKIIQKSGAWYGYGDMRLGQGRENTRQFLKDNPELANEIEAKVRAAFEEERKKAAAEQEAKRAAIAARIEAAQKGAAPTKAADRELPPLPDEVR